MFINSIFVKGELGLYQEFGNFNVILGKNKTGKSTLMKLMLYCFGVKINDFIDEITKGGLTEFVELDITCKNSERFKISRRLPSSDSIIVLKCNASGEVDNDEMDILSSEEFSDFLLEKEGYKNLVLTYGENKNASLRYYFLLRATVVDQETPAYDIFTKFGGKNYDYINNQDVLKKAIIEQLLGADNQDSQSTRFKLQRLISNQKKVSEKRRVIVSFLEEHIKKAKNKKITIQDLDSEIKNTESSINILLQEKSEVLSKMQTVSDEKLISDIANNESLLDELEVQVRTKNLELVDSKNVIKRLKEELSRLHEMLVAQRIFTEIPVIQCPVCLEPFKDEEIEKGKCSCCKRNVVIDDLEKKLSYKRMIQESIVEATEINSLIKQEQKNLKDEYDITLKTLALLKDKYFKIIKSQKDPLERILHSTCSQMESLVEKREFLNSFYKFMLHDEQLKKEQDQLRDDIKETKESLNKAESLTIAEQEGNVQAWKKLYVDLCNYIFDDVSNVNIDFNYLPLVDGKIIRENSSASLKVVARLAYVLSLFALSNEKTINHTDFVFFDSPKDKDLDPSKYSRFLKAVYKLKAKQVFITGSSDDEKLYEDIPILLKLSPQNKLLGRICNITRP